jgi:hypothetical protein
MRYSMGMLRMNAIESWDVFRMHCTISIISEFFQQVLMKLFYSQTMVSKVRCLLSPRQQF